MPHFPRKSKKILVFGKITKLELSLRIMSGLIGINEPISISAQPMDAAGPEVRDARIAAATQTVEGLSL
ncbi:MAG: hypothetical protein WA705_25255 [Candidatus Ozemobacteraceae bacterium]